MNFLPSLFFLLFSYLSIGQVSYDFAQALPPEAMNVQHVDKPYRAIYTNENNQFEFTEAGIFTLTTVVHSISRETLRESSQYAVRNGYIFGVRENDSIPCVEENDRYYFGVRQRDTLIGINSKNILRKIDAMNYILNFSENGTYTPCLITFDGKTLKLRYFNYDDKSKPFEKFKSKTLNESDGIQYITLNPTLKEWEKIGIKDYLGEEIVYTR